ncbi:MAG: hypothetical protein JNK58_03420, partial [Phycisphaerae bacterium]|nr:hypothetical protein [Phycisphaerae bacterium]
MRSIRVARLSTGLVLFVAAGAVSAEPAALLPEMVQRVIDRAVAESQT